MTFVYAEVARNINSVADARTRFDLPTLAEKTFTLASGEPTIIEWVATTPQIEYRE